jgi:cytochrome b
LNMTVLNRLRVYHAILALLSLLAYISGEWGLVHAYLGYGVSLVILVRLIWALSGAGEFGLSRFYPEFKGLNIETGFTHPSISKVLLLGIGFSLLAATMTGIAMDRGKALGVSSYLESVSTAFTNGDEAEGREIENDENEILEEIHEFFANLLVLFVVLHVSYLLIFKRSLAKFMLFISSPHKK